MAPAMVVVVVVLVLVLVLVLALTMGTSESVHTMQLVVRETVMKMATGCGAGTLVSAGPVTAPMAIVAAVRVCARQVMCGRVV